MAVRFGCSKGDASSDYEIDRPLSSLRREVIAIALR